VTTLVVPALDERPWPTLGPQVCAFIEDDLVFGPGDLRGEPARLDDEWRAIVYRMYEVHPKGSPKAGRRRFNRCAISKRKGTAKTEFAAWIAAVELHPEGPVRCDGWRWVGRHWEPVGAPVRDPYIPMVAYTEEQTEDLAYGALYAILAASPIADDFDIGLERIMRIGGDGKAVALASTPNARDGARTTFEHFDETHRFTLPGLKRAHRVMLANLPKRPAADAWALETTTIYAPGENSVAESTFDYARKVESGEHLDSRLFFFHRGASDSHDLTTDEGLRAAVIEASGPAAPWSDIDAIVGQFREPDADRAYLERVWTNRLVQSHERAFDLERWKTLARPDHAVPDGTLVTLGFDGSRFWDTTGLVATEIESGFQWPLGIWERPRDLPETEPWQVPADEVEAAIEEAFDRFDVWRLYADPPRWEGNVAAWQGAYGDRVLAWYTNRWTPMTRALRNYASAMASGEVTHDGDPIFTEHIGNAHRRYLNLRDEDGEPMWFITKERSNSPHKMDLAMAGTLSWQARTDALTAGALVQVEWTVA
jgi:phage terminase large subunit-like protein